MLKNKITRLTVALAVISLTACNEAVMVGDGYGSIGVSLDWDTALQTKADAAVELGDDTQVTVSVLDKDGNVVVEPTTYGYAALKEASFDVPVGVYTVTASTGSNHQAAWGSPFYSGEDEVTVYADRRNAAEIVCTLANVKVTASFDEEFDKYCSYYGVTVDNGVGEGLTFSNENGRLDEEGYFAVTGTLKWKLILENNDGRSYIASGTINDVKARQHYPLSFTLSEIEVDETGASVFKITLDDSITEKEFDAVLDFSQSGNYEVTTSGFDYAAGNIAVPMGDENVKTITVSMTDGIASAPVCVDGKWYELVNADQSLIGALDGIGVRTAAVNYGATSFTLDVTDYLAGIMEFGDYPVTVAAFDVKGLKFETVFAFEIISNVDVSAVSAVPSASSAELTGKWYAGTRPEGIGIEYRTIDGEWIQADASAISYDEAQKKFSVRVTDLIPSTSYMFRPYSAKDRENIKAMEFQTTRSTSPVSSKPWARFAVVTGKWHTDTKPEGLTFLYREYGTTGWIEADAAHLRLDVDEAARTFTGDITGLDPDCTYEFKAVSASDADRNLEMMDFTTHKTETIYNLGFDDWWDNDGWYPYAQGAAVPTWDTANGGVKLLGESLTEPEYTFKVEKDGNKASAKLVSKNLALFAAGNIYTGSFVKATMIPLGAELKWGVPFSSKPVALKGYYAYSPVNITNAKDNPAGVEVGDPDKCQVQIFLTDWDAPFTISTGSSTFVDMNADYIIASGKLEDSSTTNGFVEFTIPLVYRDGRTPKHVVVAAASSYMGDYFTGGDRSTMYVDEFELVYDIAELTDSQAAQVNYR